LEAFELIKIHVIHEANTNQEEEGKVNMEKKKEGGLTRARPLLPLIAAALATLSILVAIALEAVNKQSILFNLDLWINRNVPNLQNPFLRNFAIEINDFFFPIGIAFIILLFAFMLIIKRKHSAFLIALSSTAALLADYAVEILVPRARPENAVIEVSGNSFPSGHALLATVLFLLLAISFAGDIRGRANRYIFIGLNLALMILISLSRVYLNVHWMSDVLASFDMGIFMIVLGILILRAVKK
jgi:membrane-associated phospholipid phosphatase